MLLLLVALALAGGHDRTPPVFAGLDRATTCIPGPIGGDRLSRYHLTWRPARDNATPRSQIVYDVYMAASPGGESFARPHIHDRARCDVVRDAAALLDPAALLRRAGP